MKLVVTWDEDWEMASVPTHCCVEANSVEELTQQIVNRLEQYKKENRAWQDSRDHKTGESSIPAPNSLVEFLKKEGMPVTVWTLFTGGFYVQTVEDWFNNELNQTQPDYIQIKQYD